MSFSKGVREAVWEETPEQDKQGAYGVLLESADDYALDAKVAAEEGLPQVADLLKGFEWAMREAVCHLREMRHDFSVFAGRNGTGCVYFCLAKAKRHFTRRSAKASKMELGAQAARFKQLAVACSSALIFLGHDLLEVKLVEGR